MSNYREHIQIIYNKTLNDSAFKKSGLFWSDAICNSFLQEAIEYIFKQKSSHFTVKKKVVFFDNIELFEFKRKFKISNFISTRQKKINSSEFESLFNDLTNEIVNKLFSVCDKRNGNNLISFNSIRIPSQIYSVETKDNHLVTKTEKMFYESISKCENDLYTISGDSASGKTAMVANVLTTLSKKDCCYYYYDFSDVNISEEYVMFSMQNKDSLNLKRHIFVFDNIQSYPSLLPYFLQLIDVLKKIYSDKIMQVVSVCWNNALDFVKNCFDGKSKIYSLEGSESVRELIVATDLQKYEDTIVKNSSGDMLVADAIITYFLRNGVCPQQNQIAEIIYKDFINGKPTLKQNEKKILYIICCLSEFEIHVKKSYLEKIDNIAVEELERKGFYKYYVHDDEKYIVIGHRSLANKLLMYLKFDSDCEDVASQLPAKYAVNYLKKNGSEQILSTLERLDIQLRNQGNTFSNLWDSFVVMRQHMWSQMSKDSSWGDNMASIIFAAEAFDNMSFDPSSKDFFEKCVAELRKRWTYADDLLGLKPLQQEMTSECVDFSDNIRGTMKDEEKTIAYEKDMLAKNINYRTFHDNWLLGLILGVESLSNDEVGINNKKSYIKVAENIQLPDGSFYPRRVPWVTARIIMGLSRCGLSYKNESILKKACDWLISQIKPSSEMGWEIKKLKASGWKSGTGIWNSNENITLMCLCALYDAHYPVNENNILKDTVESFWINRNEISDLFVKRKSTLDIAWILDVMIKNKKDIVLMSPALNCLSDYLLDKWDTISLSSKETKTESSDVSFIAKELVSFIWHILNNNLNQLLSDLEQTYVSQDTIKDIFISYRRMDGGGSGYAHHLYEGLEKRFPGEVFFDVKVLKKQVGEFNKFIKKGIDECRVFIPIISDRCFDRCLEDNYDLDNDVFYNEMKYFKDNKDNKVIIPLIFKTKVGDLNELKSKCPKFYEVLTFVNKQESVIYDDCNSDGPSIMVQDFIDKICNKVYKNN